MTELSLSRANAVAQKFNKACDTPRLRLPYDQPEAALAAVSHVAARYENDPKRQEFVDRAYEVAAYLGGASITAIKRDTTLRHITDENRREYRLKHLNQSIDMVSGIAVGVIDEIVSAPTRPTVEQYAEPQTVSIYDTVQSLHDVRAIDSKTMLGILVVFDEVPHDAEKTARLRKETLELLRAKAHRSRDIPATINEVIGSPRNGHHGVGSVEAVVAKMAKNVTDQDSIEGLVRQRIAHELKNLFGKTV